MRPKLRYEKLHESSLVLSVQAVCADSSAQLRGVGGQLVTVKGNPALVDG